MGMRRSLRYAPFIRHRAATSVTCAALQQILPASAKIEALWRSGLTIADMIKFARVCRGAGG